MTYGHLLLQGKAHEAESGKMDPQRVNPAGISEPCSMGNRMLSAPLPHRDLLAGEGSAVLLGWAKKTNCSTEMKYACLDALIGFGEWGWDLGLEGKPSENLGVSIHPHLRRQLHAASTPWASW